MKCDEPRMLELLDIYMDLVDKQDEIINSLSQIVKKQSTELAHMKNINGYIDLEADLNMGIAEDVMKEYNAIKGEP